MARGNNISKKIVNFLDNNEELVNKYHRIPGVINIYDIVPDIIDRLNANPKLLQESSLNIVLRDAINLAINEETDIISSISNLALKDFGTQNLIQTYFKEVGKIYEENGDDYDIEYCPENKDLLIKLNLKTVISVAKQYQGMGIDLEDLISVGNLGLCKAWEKFKPSHNNVQEDIINSLPDESVMQGDDILRILMKYLTYGKVMERAQERFKTDKLYNMDIIKKWIINNVKPPRFSSVAVMWIKAYILAEIDQNSRLVKKPKIEIYRDKEKYGTYIKEVTVDIDQPINLENGITVGDTLGLEEEDISDVDVNDSYNYFKTNIRKLLKGLNARDKSILLKRFGIGLPRPMSPREIGSQENLTISRVCQLFQRALDKVRANAEKLDISVDEMFAACSSFK